MWGGGGGRKSRNKVILACPVSEIEIDLLSCRERASEQRVGGVSSSSSMRSVYSLPSKRKDVAVDMLVGSLARGLVISLSVLSDRR